MSDDTTTDAAAEPVEPDAGAGQTATEPKADAKDEKTFDAAYVKSLRREAADFRKQLETASAKLREVEDRDKSESEKLTQRAAEAERRAVEAEATLLRLEVAAERRFSASAVPLLSGTSREEIEVSADRLTAFAKENEKAPPGFDGGARETPETKKSPEAAHADLLMQALGRVP